MEEIKKKKIMRPLNHDRSTKRYKFFLAPQGSILQACGLQLRLKFLNFLTVFHKRNQF